MGTNLARLIILGPAEVSMPANLSSDSQGLGRFGYNQESKWSHKTFHLWTHRRRDGRFCFVHGPVFL